MNHITIDDIKYRVIKIEAESGDDERAHGDEDDLHREVLRAIAAGADNAPELAKEALKTLGIEFQRWCA